MWIEIRERGFRVLLDSNHGAGAIVGTLLLSFLGSESRFNPRIQDRFAKRGW